MIRQLGILLLGFSLLNFVGCGPSGKVAEMSVAPKVVTWPTLDTLMEPERNMFIVMSVQTGDLAGAKKAASDPKLKEAVDAFEKDPVPAAFASPARDAAKADVVKHYRELIEGKGDLRKVVQELQTAKGKLVDINLK
jgi:hypothetical protein